MNWMLWWGANDEIFPAEQSINKYKSILQVLGASNTLKAETVMSGQGHSVTSEEIDYVIEFVWGRFNGVVDSSVRGFQLTSALGMILLALTILN